MRKSQLLQFFLTLLFGPLGLFYSNVPAALAFLAATVLIGTFTSGIGVFFLWPVIVLFGFYTVHRYNKALALEEDRHQELVQAASRGGAGTE